MVGMPKIKSLSGVNNTIQKVENASNVITSNGGTTNTIIFNGTNATKNEIIGNIYTTGTAYAEKTSFSATNHIAFSGSSTSNLIQGNITSAKSGWSGATNTISFANSNQSGTNLIQGEVIANGATNTISFSGSANSEIQGNISANGSSLGGNGSNTITFDSTGTNTITGNISINPYGSYKGTNRINFSAGINNAITGNISNSGGSNTLTLNGTTNTINGDITNNAGTNSIASNSGSLTLNKDSGIISTTGGGTAANTITAAILNITNASLSLQVEITMETTITLLLPQIPELLLFHPLVLMGEMIKIAMLLSFQMVLSMLLEILQPQEEKIFFRPMDLAIRHLAMGLQSLLQRVMDKTFSLLMELGQMLLI